MFAAVFTDIHGNYQALDAILNEIKKYNVTDIICLGDVIGLGPDSDKCLKRIKEENIRFIVGNHELNYTKHIDKYTDCSEGEKLHNEWIHDNMTETIENNVLSYEANVRGKKVLFVHYFLSNKLYPYESSSIFESDKYKYVMDRLNYDYVFYGHLHQERKDVINNKTFYCLDSSGCTKDDNTFFYLVSIRNEVSVEKINVKYNRESFIESLLSRNYPQRKEIALKFFGINIKDTNL